MRTAALAFFASLFCFACTPAGPPEEAEVAPGSAPAAAETAAPSDDGPAPTAKAVWNHLQEADYESNWSLWPGKGEFFEGQEPHGALLTNYLNPPAMRALEGDATSMPPGAIIVKHNYTPDRTLAAVTVMYKSAGFDPEHNDWFWLKRAADGTVEASGKVEGCQSCHGAASDNDYVLTGEL